MALKDLKKAELVALCEQHELDTTGTKADLVARLEPVLDWDEPDQEEVVVEEPVVEEVVEEVVEDAPATVGDGLPTEQFVREAYLSILGREPDANGLKHYVTCIDWHGTMTREQVVEDLSNSDEAKAR